MSKKPSPKELEEYAERLRGLLGVLTGDIDKLEQEALGEGSLPTEASAEGRADGYHLEFSLQLLERDESAVREILQALDRIKTGQFGLCESCQVPIVKERLRLMPHARYCIACQRKEEEGQL